MNIELFVFDWSGTISDDRYPVYQANLRMRRHFGVYDEISFEDWLPTVQVSVTEAFRRYGVNVGEDEVWESYRTELRHVLETGVRPTIIPSAFDALQILSSHNVRLGVFSAHPHHNLESEAREYGLYDLFEFVVGDIRNKADALSCIARDLELEPTSILYTGDTVHDIRATKSAGLISAGVATGYHSRDRLAAEEPHYLFDSLSEIIALTRQH